MSLFGVGLDIEIKRINTQFKILLQKKAGVGIRSLASVFHSADKNKNRTLEKTEFVDALGQIG